MLKMRSLVLGAIMLHALVTVVHGAAHAQIPVPTTDEQGVFIGLVIVVAPVVAGVLFLAHRTTSGALTLFLAMGAALVFGIINHLILYGPDNISQVPGTAWGRIFVWSALALVVLEGAGVVVGIMALAPWRHPRRARLSSSTV